MTGGLPAARRRHAAWGFLVALSLHAEASAQVSVARQWNESLLCAIRNDFARPTVHARNLFHVSIALYDAWAAYDDRATTFLLGREVGEFRCPFEGVDSPTDLRAAREEAMSYGAYRLLRHRYRNSPRAEETLPQFSAILRSLGYDPTLTSTDYRSGSPAALGNYIAECLIQFGLQDGSNEQQEYRNLYYEPVNPAMITPLRGNRTLVDPNRWQPLVLKDFIDQTNVVYNGQQPDFLSPEWGRVTPFALRPEERTVHARDGNEYWVYHDPGPPAYIEPGGTGPLDEDYKWGHTLPLIWSSHLDPSDGVMMDTSPAALGDVYSEPAVRRDELRRFYNRLEGGGAAAGRELNPRTGEAYAGNVVPRGDYTRVVAEYWPDGPSGETPPGHWFAILNEVSDHPGFEKRFRGNGPVLDDLEWDAKAYLALAGALHDAAIAAWSVKGRYDYIRPIGAIRWMADNGQSSDPDQASYSPDGLPLVEGVIEVIREGDPVAEVAGDANFHVGKIKVHAWRGPDFIDDPKEDVAGVAWILALSWWTYQAANFVTPPTAGYVSGTATFSHAAAEVMTLLTGDDYFPAGLHQFTARANEFLQLERGPSVDVTLQWATYRDAAAEASLATFWAGIHAPVDDLPGRVIGRRVGQDAFNLAARYFDGRQTAVVERRSGAAPDAFELYQNYPNPFNSGTTIRFDLEGEADVELALFDLAGQRVASLMTGLRTASSYEVAWDGRDTDGKPLASGVYFYRMTAGSDTKHRKLLLLR